MEVSCSNPECNVSETGYCLEGFPELSDCTRYGSQLFTEAAEVENEPILEDRNTSEISSTVDEYIDDKISLNGQFTLDQEDVGALLKNIGGRIIACVGPADVGKTTLFASIYDLFQEGPINNLSFGGSATIYSFEELCHTARLSSKRTKAVTRRTSAADGLRFYQLSLHDVDKNRISLYLADRAGEYYNNAADSYQACIKLTEVSRADIVLLLVDAESLGDRSKKHAAKRKALSIIEAFSEANMLQKTARLIITMTKYDLSVKNKTSEAAMVEYQKIITQSSEILGADVDVTGEIIAARPDSLDDAEAGYGISSLLNSIISCDIPKVKMEKKPKIKPKRTFLDPEFAQWT